MSWLTKNPVVLCSESDTNPAELKHFRTPGFPKTRRFVPCPMERQRVNLVWSAHHSPHYAPEGQALEQNREHHHNISEGQHDFALTARRKRQRQCHGYPASQASPGHNGDR